MFAGSAPISAGPITEVCLQWFSGVGPGTCTASGERNCSLLDLNCKLNLREKN